MEYFKIVLFILTVILINIFIIALSFFRSRKIKNTNNQLLTYECGFDNNPLSFKSFNIKFYMIAISFLVFDIEIIFFMLFARYFKHISSKGFLHAAIFLIILCMAFVYEWWKGVFKCQQNNKRKI